MLTDFKMKKKVIIIGAGVSGLTAGIYARKAGFEVEIYESHFVAGGMCTGWKRKGYIVDGCIHWITGSRKGSDLYNIWETCGALGGDVNVVHHDYIVSVCSGDSYYYVYSDLNKLEREFTAISPKEMDRIKELVRIIRIYEKLPIPACKPQELMNFADKIRFYFPYLKAGKSLSMATKNSIREYISRFHSPLIRQLLTAVIPNTEMSANALFFTLATFSSRDGGWPSGGSHAMAQRMKERFLSMGGNIHLSTSVNKIVIREGRAIGIELSDGKVVNADYVVPAVSADVLLNQLLEGKYSDSYFEERFADNHAYKLLSATIIALGVDADVKNYPHSLYLKMEHPIVINKIEVSECSVCHYDFEPSFSPVGKSLIEVTLNDPEFKYWHGLKASSPEKYRQAKESLANHVVSEIETVYPELKGKIEIIDVATPLTYHRYTSTYQGTYMSFCATPKSTAKNHKGVIDGIENMYLAGQWVLLQGGLPITAIAGKFAIQRICRQEKRNIVK
jgi:phytoene dehydrogenase-like protein